MAKWLFTSESVTEGHPDKISDNISSNIEENNVEKKRVVNNIIKDIISSKKPRQNWKSRWMKSSIS